ncbi:Chaperone protein ClpB1 [Apostasia shenzhenica]|uniref:Chaperone protein ClpB1 n=1 Tax=Apostasia shenzhenica TaxID=1088818 RepID=A0A2I0BGB3_9ASPA|nr:Chaperone protein ClpB1 [Apostasia shenzhenica]
MRAGSCAVHQSLTLEAAAVVKQAVSLARRRGHAQVTPLHVASAMLSSSPGLLRSACTQSHSHPLQCKALELCFNVALNRLPAASSSGLILGHHRNISLSNALVAAFKRAQAHLRRGSVDGQQPPLLAVKIELEQLVISILDDPSVSRVMREAGFSSAQVKSNVEQAVSSSDLPCSKNHNPNPNFINPAGESIVEALSGEKKRGVVVVGETLAAAEAAVKELTGKLDKGEVPEDLRSLRLIEVRLSAVGEMGTAEEVGMKVEEMMSMVRRCCLERRALMHLGDLKWVSEYWEKRRDFYGPVEKMIREIGKMVSVGFGGENRLLGVATYGTYRRCREGNPSLEMLLGLHPLPITSNCSEIQSHLSSSTRREVITTGSSNHSSLSCSLPSWLQHHKEEKRKENINSPDINHYSSLPPSSSSNYYDQLNSSMLQTSTQTWRISLSTNVEPGSTPTSIAFSPESRSSNPNPNPNSASSSGTMEVEYHAPRFKELSAENLKLLCNALERQVPWQEEIVADIASTVLQCRSGMLCRRRGGGGRRRRRVDGSPTWLLLSGNDAEGKEKIARELAVVVFRSHKNFILVERLVQSNYSYVERLAELVRENCHRVILMEDVEQLDYLSRRSIRDSIESGKIQAGSSGDHEDSSTTGDAIFILSCKSFESMAAGCSPPVPVKKKKELEGYEEVSSSAVCLDLNMTAEELDHDDEEDCPSDDLGIVDAVDGIFSLNVDDTCAS